MRKTRQYYILQSIIFSSIVYIGIIVSLAYNSIYTPIPEEEEGIYIELADFIPPPIDLNQIPENELSADDRRNIAVNKAMKNQAKTDAYDYSDIEESDNAYKEELVKNAISDDEYKKIFERDDWDIENKVNIEDKTEVEENKDDKPSNFQGATYISYFLKDRYKMKIPVPTYRCETSGKIIVNISVNRDGIVSSYDISDKSSLNDCLRSAAIKSVKNSRFNQNYNASLKQRGTITYIFEAQ